MKTWIFCVTKEDTLKKVDDKTIKQYIYKYIWRKISQCRFCGFTNDPQSWKNKNFKIVMFRPGEVYGHFIEFTFFSSHAYLLLWNISLNRCFLNNSPLCPMVFLVIDGICVHFECITVNIWFHWYLRNKLKSPSVSSSKIHIDWKSNRNSKVKSGGNPVQSVH